MGGVLTGIHLPQAMVNISSENWRSSILSRRSNCSLSCGTFQAIANAFMMHASKTGMLSGAEMYQLEAVCAHAVQWQRASAAFRDWLCANENRRVGSEVSVAHLYADFHASRLQRLYLRSVLKQIAPAVCAGGFPASAWCNMRGLPSWRPGDIDIFLFSDDDMDRASNLYECVVGDNMGALMVSEEWRTSCESVIGGGTPHAEGRSVRRRISKKRRVCGDDAASPEHPWSSRDLHGAVVSWTVSARDSHQKATYASYSVDQSSVNFNDFLGRVRETEAHLPRALSPPAHRVVYTKQLHLTRTGLVRHAPKSLIKVNLIRLNRVCSPTGEQHAVEMSKQICQDFDITACCVAITELSDDLHFTSDSFKLYNGAGEALTSRSLVLTSTAFACQNKSVHWQMQRISKYLARLFAWKGVVARA